MAVFQKGQGGRKPGSKNRLTLAKQKLFEELKQKWNDALPKGAFKGNALELLQYYYKHPDTPPDLAIDCANKAMQFEVPKKSENTHEDKTNYVQRIVKMPEQVVGKTPREQLDNWVKEYGAEESEIKKEGLQ
jgi:hypothetical protein